MKGRYLKLYRQKDFVSKMNKKGNIQSYVEKHLNPFVSGLPVSPTLNINQISNEIRAAGRKIYKLGFGQSPFPVPVEVQEELKRNAHQKAYLPVNGIEVLRKQISSYLKNRFDIEYDHGNVIVGPGSKELMFILSLIYKSETILAAPSWVSYSPQAKILGHKVNWMRTEEKNKWKLTPEIIEKNCKDEPDKPRLLFLNYPNNPTGFSYTAGELEELSHSFRKYNIVVVSDEIYGEIQFDRKHTSLASFYPEGTIISSGLSKWCGAGGWRLGFFAFPEELEALKKSAISVASETYSTVSAPVQYAGVVAFGDSSDLQDYRNDVMTILKSIAAYYTDKMNSAGFNAQMTDGGFYMFPNFAPFKEKLSKIGINDSTELCDRLLKDTGVAALPGSSFGMNPEDLMMRIAFVDFNGEKVMEALKGVEKIDDLFLEKHCADTTTAINEICSWVKS